MLLPSLCLPTPILSAPLGTHKLTKLESKVHLLTPWCDWATLVCLCWGKGLGRGCRRKALLSRSTPRLLQSSTLKDLPKGLTSDLQSCLYLQLMCLFKPDFPTNISHLSQYFFFLPLTLLNKLRIVNAYYVPSGQLLRLKTPIWWHMLLVPAHKMLRQEDCLNTERQLDCSPRLQLSSIVINSSHCWVDSSLSLTSYKENVLMYNLPTWSTD